MENFTPPRSPVYTYYACLEIIDEVNRYKPGGFHPALIGDILDSRFKVVNKLGCSVEATVWLCRDVTRGKWRAIKIYAAEFSHENLASVELVQPNPEQLSIFATSLEHFWVVGPNGRHLCAVQPLLGPSVSEIAFHYRNEPLFLRDVCQQMAKAVHLLHKKGLYHGHLHPSNLRFLVKDTIHKLTEEEMNEMLGDPNCCQVRQCVNWRHPDTIAFFRVSTEHENNDNKTPNYDSNMDGDRFRCDCFRGPYGHTYHVSTCHTFNNPSLPANVPKYVVFPTELGLFSGGLDAAGSDSYVMCSIALADLDACIRHTPNNNNTTTTSTPLRTTRHPTGYTAPETWATTTATNPNPLTTTTTTTTAAAAVCGTDPFLDRFRFPADHPLPVLANYLGLPPPGAIEGWVAGGAVPRGVVVGGAVAEDVEAADVEGEDVEGEGVEEEMAGEEAGAGVGEWWEPKHREEVWRRAVYGTGDAMEEQLMVRLRWMTVVEEEEWLDMVEEGDGDWFADAWDDGLKCERFMSQGDIRLFADLLGKMFKWRPEDRATMDEVVNHPWIRDGEDDMDCS